MPKTARKNTGRTPVGIPNPMLAEIQRIINEHPELNYSRQQFVESAIRDKIIKIKQLENLENKSSQVGS